MATETTLAVTCPHCGATEPKVTLESGADVTFAVRAYAEVNLGVDLLPEGVKWDTYGTPERYMPDFRLGDVTEQIEIIEHGNFRLDDEILIAHCWNCQGDVTEQFRILLDQLHPREV